MKEKDLIELGFEREDVTAEDAGTENGFYYYTLEIEDLSLITSADDEVENDNWKVFIFDYGGFEFTELEKLKLFIDVLKSTIKKIK